MAEVLNLRQITKNFGDKTAVDQVNFSVSEGEIFGLLGANGAGKTTTMRMVLGLIYPDSGDITWNGEKYSDKLTALMGYLPEERGLYPKVKVSEQIAYLAELRGISRKKADANLKMWLDRFEVPEYYNKKVEELSKGNQQKIQFIASVIHDPDILVLDEAFSGLDPVNVELLKNTVLDLKKQGKSILFSSHRMDHVEELCERICIMNKGRILREGNIKAIKDSFPKERIILETAQPVQNLERIRGVVSIHSREAGCEIKINNLQAAQEILQTASAQTHVNRFQIMEPSLNEIFIRTVGEHRE